MSKGFTCGVHEDKLTDEMACRRMPFLLLNQGLMSISFSIGIPILKCFLSDNTTCTLKIHVNLDVI